MTPVKAGPTAHRVKGKAEDSNARTEIAAVEREKDLECLEVVTASNDIARRKRRSILDAARDLHLEFAPRVALIPIRPARGASIIRRREQRPCQRTLRCDLAAYSWLRLLGSSRCQLP